MDILQKRTIRTYELIGIVFITLLGSLLHFIFELSGFNPVVGAFSAVNESVWEHLKLGFWPLVFYTVFEYWRIKDKSNNFFLAKTAGALTIIIVIPAIFYGYTSIVGESILAVDILSFVITVVVAQFLGYKILTYKQQPKIIELVSLVVLIVLAVLFVIFTFYPPHLPLFLDPINEDYGIIEHLH